MADYEQLVFEGLEWNAGDIQKRQDSIGYSLRYGAFLNDPVFPIWLKQVMR